MSPLQSWAQHYLRGGVVRFAKGENIPVEGEGGAAFGMYPSPRASNKQGALSGFLDALAGAQNPNSPSVFQPEYDQYAKGKKYGDLASIVSMALPGLGMGAAAAKGPLFTLARQGAPKMRAQELISDTLPTNFHDLATQSKAYGGLHGGNLKVSDLLKTDVQNIARNYDPRMDAVYKTLGAQGIQNPIRIRKSAEGLPILEDGGHRVGAALKYLQKTGKDIDIPFIYQP